MPGRGCSRVSGPKAGGFAGTGRTPRNRQRNSDWVVGVLGLSPRKANNQLISIENHDRRTRLVDPWATQVFHSARENLSTHMVRLTAWA